jgi:hypothetical protein
MGATRSRAGADWSGALPRLRPWAVRVLAVQASAMTNVASARARRVHRIVASAGDPERVLNRISSRENRIDPGARDERE